MYADLYFLGNTVLDLFLLHLTGQITGEKTSGRRLLLGAFCGGSGALLWLYIRGGRYTKPIDLLAALLLAAVMCRLALAGHTGFRVVCGGLSASRGSRDCASPLLPF